MPDAGDTIGGRYELVEQIGSGGFSVVWRAQDTHANETVAVKHPNMNVGKPPEAVEKYFQRELNALRTIQDNGGHPHIMSLRDSLVERGTEFMVVDLIDGDVVEVHGSLNDPDTVAKVGAPICDVFSFIHDLELIYRDLKPDNIMLSSDGRAVLIDFNTTRQQPRCGECGQTINLTHIESDRCPNCNTELDSGTVIRAGPRGQSKYKPPEIANEEGRQGPWSDVYSIGKLLFFLLAGYVRPLPGDDPRQSGISCPDYLAEIIVKATRRDPVQRYRNASIMKRALELKDPNPQLPEAVLENIHTGERVTIAPGDTIGRKNSSGPYATVELDDPTSDKLISRVHAKFDISSDGWIIVDQSSNGTAIDDGGGWSPIIASDSYDGPPEKAPPRHAVLDEGTRIGIPRPDDGVQFEFHPG
jgi:protein kinase/serine/threonine-protein kinase